MAITDKNTIYNWFQTDAFPTEAQFKATWDSFWHKSESIPVSQITGLNELFIQTASVSQLNQKANKDGSNIDVNNYSLKLGIKNLLQKGSYSGTAQNLKEEIDQKAFLKIFPSFADFPLPETLESTEENKLYLDRFTGEIYLVWYERANDDDPGFDLSYKKM